MNYLASRSWSLWSRVLSGGWLHKLTTN